ncbi:hypothetical protein FRB90_002542 [Tulasnella sp. 427]|nr:hypothetical protein FRB90_002542 [Tulasnella sp. 427]
MPAGAPIPPFSPEPPADPVTLSQPQLDALKAQIHAFKLIQRGMPQEIDGKTVLDRVVDNAVQNQKAEEDSQNETRIAFSKGPRLEEKTESPVYPHNAYLQDKQRALRQAVVTRLGEATILPGDREEDGRFRKQHIRDVRQTESLERWQRVGREKRVKQKHLDYPKTICDHGKRMLDASCLAQGKSLKLARAVLKYHVDAKKGEQKRIERISKKRLKALKNDDDEAYLKLIDTAKDTRITHLLRQTDSYLDSLAQAVRDQQRDDHKPGGQIVDGSAFGASRMEGRGYHQRRRRREEEEGRLLLHRSSYPGEDYQSAKHPVGGTLKEYQLKGLRWMVSLYDNRLNRTLADEMVPLTNTLTTLVTTGTIVATTSRLLSDLSASCTGTKSVERQEITASSQTSPGQHSSEVTSGDLNGNEFGDDIRAQYESYHVVQQTGGTNDGEDATYHTAADRPAATPMLSTLGAQLQKSRLFTGTKALAGAGQSKIPFPHRDLRPSMRFLATKVRLPNPSLQSVAHKLCEDGSKGGPRGCKGPSHPSFPHRNGHHSKRINLE